MSKTTVKKTSQGYNYKYTDLAAIHTELEVQGITYYQFVKYDADAGVDYMWTVLNDKEPIQGCRIVQAELSGKSNPAQANGSALTYARRYSLLMALGWATDDDDGASMTNIKAADPTPKQNIDFNEVRQQIKDAQSANQVRTIYAGIPVKLKQYFEADCKKRTTELEGSDA